MSKIIPIAFNGSEHILTSPSYRAKMAIAQGGVNLNSPQTVSFDPLAVAVIGCALLNQEDPKRKWDVNRFADAMDTAAPEEQEAMKSAVVDIAMDGFGLAYDGEKWGPKPAEDADPPTPASKKTPSK